MKICVACRRIYFKTPSVYRRSYINLVPDENLSDVVGFTAKLQALFWAHISILSRSWLKICVSYRMAYGLTPSVLCAHISILSRSRMKVVSPVVGFTAKHQAIIDAHISILYWSWMKICASSLSAYCEIPSVLRRWYIKPVPITDENLSHTSEVVQRNSKRSSRLIYQSCPDPGGKSVLCRIVYGENLCLVSYVLRQVSMILSALIYQSLTDLEWKSISCLSA